MEKTMEYALNEALAMGRRSATQSFNEVELREKIAQQIEKFRDAGEFLRGFPGTEEDALTAAIKIIRGNNVSN